MLNMLIYVKLLLNNYCIMCIYILCFDYVCVYATFIYMF